MDGPPPKRRKTRSDLSEALQRVASKSSQVTRKPKAPKEEGVRTVRPRPLHVNDKVDLATAVTLNAIKFRRQEVLLH